MVCCGESQLLENQWKDTLLNPSLLVEILSPSTRDYDLGLKFAMYKEIPSFREYLAIEQETIGIHHFCLDQESRNWQQQDLGFDDVIRFAFCTAGIPVRAMYQGLL